MSNSTFHSDYCADNVIVSVSVLLSSCAASELTWPPLVDSWTTPSQSLGSAPEKDPLWISTGRSHLSLLWRESLWGTASRPAETDTHCRQRPVTHIWPQAPLLLSPSRARCSTSVYSLRLSTSARDVIHAWHPHGQNVIWFKKLKRNVWYCYNMRIFLFVCFLRFFL